MDDQQVAELESALSETWSWARTTSRAGAQALDPRLDVTAYPLVSAIGWRGAMRPSELSALLQLDRSTISRQIDAAARLGLLERAPDPDDARAVTVRLTAAGQVRLDRLKAARTERWRAALATWDAADLTTLTRLLHQLTAVDLGGLDPAARTDPTGPSATPTDPPDPVDPAGTSASPASSASSGPNPVDPAGTVGA